MIAFHSFHHLCSVRTHRIGQGAIEEADGRSLAIGDQVVGRASSSSNFEKMSKKPVIVKITLTIAKVYLCFWKQSAYVRSTH